MPHNLSKSGSENSPGTPASVENAVDQRLKIAECRGFIISRFLLIFCVMPVIFLSLLVLAFGHALFMVALILAMSCFLIFCIPPVFTECLEKLKYMLGSAYSRSLIKHDPCELLFVLVRYIAFTGLLIGAVCLSPCFAIVLLICADINLCDDGYLWKFCLPTSSDNNSSVKSEEIPEEIIDRAWRKLLIECPLML